MLSFFLPLQLQVPGLFLPLIYFIFRTWQLKAGIHKPTLLAALFSGLPYLLYLLALPFTKGEYKETASKLVEYRMGFLLVPLTLALVSPVLRRLILKEMRWFVYGATLVCFIANIWFIVKYTVSANGFSGVNHVTYRTYFEDFTGQHPTYMSMYLVLGASWLLLKGGEFSRWLRFLLLALILVFLLALLAKSPLIALLLIFAHQAWKKRSRLWQYKWIIFGMAGAGTLACIFIPFIRQRIGEMAGLTGKVEGNVTGNSIYVRKMIWSVDTGMLKTYWLTGCGPGRLLPLLKMRYFFHSMYYGYNVSSYDPHNEYFFNWLAFGLTGILVLLALLTAYAVKAIQHKNLLAIYLLITLCITFFTESVLATQHGLLFFTFFCNMYFFSRKNEDNFRYSA